MDARTQAERAEHATLLDRLFPHGLRGKRIHVLGAGGSGIAAIPRLALDAGASVTACDRGETTMTRLLEEQGITVTLNHDVSHVEGIDLLVTNPMVVALHPDHPEIRAAEARGIPVILWQQLLGFLMRDDIGISVAGVHGKGSTTALLGAITLEAGLDPSIELGAVVPEWGSNIRLGKGAYFLNEADEWNYNFLHYHPRMVVLTAVEFDHPEFFRGYDDIRDAFVQFLGGMDMDAETDGVIAPTLVLNADSPGCLDVRAHLGDDWPGQTRTFSVAGAPADVTAEDIRDDTETSFTLHLDAEVAGRVTLHTPGRHNIANAVAAAAAADVLGIPAAVIVRALTQFPGLKRRFEVIEDGDATFVDDYAHHPHAIALTLDTVRRRFPGRRVIAVFQPTLYTRLQRFLVPFSESFDAADEVVVVEIQPSREHDTGLIHGSALVEKVAAREAFRGTPEAVHYGGDFDETATLIRRIRRPGDVIAVLGSGPVNNVIAKARTHPVG